MNKMKLTVLALCVAVGAVAQVPITVPTEAEIKEANRIWKIVEGMGVDRLVYKSGEATRTNQLNYATFAPLLSTNWLTIEGDIQAGVIITSHVATVRFEGITNQITMRRDYCREMLLRTNEPTVFHTNQFKGGSIWWGPNIVITNLNEDMIWRHGKTNGWDITH